MTEGLIAIGIIILVAFFVLRNDPRPEGCTCDSYNWFYNGPVNDCPVHKHWADDMKQFDE